MSAAPSPHTPRPNRTPAREREEAARHRRSCGHDHSPIAAAAATARATAAAAATRPPHCRDRSSLKCVDPQHAPWAHRKLADAKRTAARIAVLREQFVALHSPALLEDLLQSFRKRYTCVVEDPERHARNSGACKLEGCCHVDWDSPALALPKRGDLDLEKVKESTYFFA